VNYSRRNDGTGVLPHGRASHPNNVVCELSTGIPNPATRLMRYNIPRELLLEKGSTSSSRRPSAKFRNRDPKHTAMSGRMGGGYDTARKNPGRGKGLQLWNRGGPPPVSSRNGTARSITQDNPGTKNELRTLTRNQPGKKPTPRAQNPQSGHMRTLTGAQGHQRE